MKNKLSLSKYYLRTAQSYWKERHDDDSKIDYACTELMFSIELGLKYILELNGVDANKKHELRVLLNQLPAVYVNTNWFKTLLAHADITKDWYVQSRYNDNFSVVSSVMEDYLVACEEMLRNAADIIDRATTTEDVVQKVLNKLRSDVPTSYVMKYLPDIDNLPEDIVFESVVEVLRDNMRK